MQLGLQGLILLVVFELLWFGYFSLCNLSESAFQSGFILPAIFGERSFLVVLLLSVLQLIFLRTRVHWSNFEDRSVLRILTSVLVVIIAWDYAFSDYNYYFDSWFRIDRALLVAAAVGVVLRPAVLPLFLILLFAFSEQFNYPLGATDVTDKRLYFDLLILLNAAVLCRAFVPLRSALVFGVATVVVTANYYYPGILKLQLSPNFFEWVTHAELQNLFVASYLHGWLSWLDEGAITAFAAQIASISPLLAFLTLLIELGSVFSLLHRRIFVSFAILRIGLHAAIFLLSGVLFWKWIILNLVLIAVVYRVPSEDTALIFSRRSFFCSVPLILLAPLVFRAAPLAWFDTRVVNYYKVFVQVDDIEYEVPNSFFGPYHVAFQQSRFYYLSKRKLFVGTFGGTGRYEIAAAIRAAGEASALERLREHYGTEHYDKEKRETFERFLKVVFRNTNYDIRTIGLRSVAFGPPHHIYSSARGVPYQGQKPADAVVVRFYETYFDGLRIQRIVNERDILSLKFRNPKIPAGSLKELKGVSRQ